MIKDAATFLAAPLTFLINLSLQTGSVPSAWKTAKVIPLFKNGSRTDTDNYRPISILPAMSKILERVVHKQLMDHLERNSLLFKHQFGFRSKRSTELAVALVTDFIRKEADKCSLTGAIFIDLSKAFDTVSHSNVLNKLPSFGICGNELMWFTDYLFNRTQVVHCNGFSSEAVPISCGVPQGSIIGPLLFLLQFNNVHKVLKHSQIITYADDTVMYMSSSSLKEIEKKLSEDLNSLKSWFDSNELVINLNKGKTETMTFGTSKRLNKLESREMEINLNGVKVSATSSYKYLGVHLDPTLNFEDHFNKIYKKATGQLNLLRRIRGLIDSSTVELIYKTMIMPVFGYCGLTFLARSQSHKNRIESIERRARVVIKSNNLTVDLRIPKIDAVVRKRAFTVVFDNLQHNVCDVMKEYFTKNAHGKNTRNEEQSVKLPLMKTEFGRKGFYFMAAKEYNNLPLQARKIESRLVFNNFLDSHFNDI